MKVYVGAPLSHWPQARKTMSALHSMGHNVTHDWTLGAEAYFAGDRSEKASDIASKCIDGVKACDFAFFLPSIDIAMQGVWCELGAALALAKPVIAYAPFLNGHPLNKLGVDDWMNSRGAFFQHPLVSLRQYYADALKFIEVVENQLFERQNRERDPKTCVSKFGGATLFHNGMQTECSHCHVGGFIEHAGDFSCCLRCGYTQ